MRYLIEIRDGDFWHSSGYAYDSILEAKLRMKLLAKRGLQIRLVDTQTGGEV